MKKLGLLVMPLMAVSLLASCGGGGDKPSPKEYTLSITLDNCKIGEESSSYSKKYTEGATIDAINVTPIDDYALTENSVPSEYKDYWEESATPGTWTLSGLMMNSDYKLTISATELVTLTIKLNNCKIGEESTTYTKTYLKGKIIDSVDVTPSEGHILAKNSVPSEYEDYWEESATPGTWTLSGLTMNGDHKLTISAAEEVTLTIELNNCKIGGSTTYTKAYAKDSTIEPVTVTPDDDLTLTADSVSEEYQEYWSKDGEWKLHDLVMDQSYTITINAGYIFSVASSDITISPNLIIPNQKYEGRIFINEEAIDSKILPLSLDSVILDDDTNTDITDKCLYEVEDDNTASSFEIPADSTTSGIAVTLTLKDIVSAKWYDYVNWWDYCSNEESSAKATEADINNGKEVYVKVNGLMHSVRLTDVDHKEPGEEIAQAYCTFEFVNVITDANGAVTTEWDIKEPEANSPNNRNFPNSTLNDFLNVGEDSILKKLPEGLQGKIKEVDKRVGIGSSYSTNTPYKTKLFPLAYAEMEIPMYEVSVPANEGNIYKYHSYHSDFRKKRAVGSTSLIQYWLRTPFTSGDSTQAWCVNSSGSLVISDSYVGENEHAVAPAFCI